MTHVKRISGGTSTGVTILLTHEGKRHILTYPALCSSWRPSDLDMDYLASARHFHLSSLFLHKALQPDLPRVSKQLKSEGLTLSLDTNDDPEDLWGSPLDELLGIVDIFLPNEDEACRISGKTDAESAIEVLAQARSTSSRQVRQARRAGTEGKPALGGSRESCYACRYYRRR